MSRYILAAVAASLAVGTAQAQAPQRPDTLRAFLQQTVGGERETQYMLAYADLNGDRRDEALVFLTGPAWCGGGGCRLLVLTPVRGSWRVVARTTVTNPPIRVLSSSSRGWRDLGVRVAGGGVRAYEARLRFNGRAYPGNPSMIEPSRTTLTGRVLIGDGEGRPLFP